MAAKLTAAQRAALEAMNDGGYACRQSNGFAVLSGQTLTWSALVSAKTMRYLINAGRVEFQFDERRWVITQAGKDALTA
jgi:hypothetical protein